MDYIFTGQYNIDFFQIEDTSFGGGIELAIDRDGGGWWTLGNYGKSNYICQYRGESNLLAILNPFQAPG